jgi:hypothetical protein
VQREKIGLVGCVKSKRGSPAPAADLYTSALFSGRRRRVEATCSRWYILSARHGLVPPGQELSLDDETVTTQGVAARRAWAGRARIQLQAALGDVGRYDFEIHAGAAYVAYGLQKGLESAGSNERCVTAQGPSIHG